MYIIHLIIDRKNRNISRKEKQEKEEEKKNFSTRGIDLVVRSVIFIILSTFVRFQRRLLSKMLKYLRKKIPLLCLILLCFKKIASIGDTSTHFCKAVNIDDIDNK